MIPYDIDPSLHSGEPVPAALEDGFSPPPERPHVPVAGTESPNRPDLAQAPQDS